ncbi:MAG: SGNH/GDSL hydrolase family protein [Marmoricola sp.]|nr:SGNH/GDSL hydrolase family protein [Marmoricola sp.]
MDRRPGPATPGLLAALLVLLLAGCAVGGAPRTSGTRRTSRSAGSSIVALGDSVPAGSACDCTPYPQLSATELSPADGPTVAARNDAVGGFTTDDVLQQLGGAGSVVKDVTGADLVEVQVGANDVGHSDACGTDVACYRPAVPVVRENLDDIVARVHHLADGHPVRVVLLDYWSVWLGGRYAQAQGEAYVDAAAAVTDEVNTTIREVAAQTGSAYVDLRAAFKGPDYSYDETHYLAPDGDHPNAAGHQKIAAALVQVVEG